VIEVAFVLENPWRIENKMASIFTQLNSSMRRTLSGLGFSDAGNETDTFPRRIHRRVSDVVGAARVKYLTFVALIFSVFLYILATHDVERYYQQQNNVSPFHFNPYPKAGGSSDTADSQANTTTASPTYAPTMAVNGTIDGSTTIITDNGSDASLTLFWSITLTMLGWLMMVQIVACIRRGGLSMGGDMAERRRQLHEEQRRAIMEHFRFMQMFGRRQMNPAMMQRLRMAFMQRDFTGDDYEMLMQLDELQNVNATRRGAPSSVINRLPTHRLTQAEIDAMKQASSLSSRDPEAGGGDESKTANDQRKPAGGHHHHQHHHDAAGGDENDDEDAPKCLICLAPYEAGNEVRSLLCLHQFHKSCVDQWLQTNAVCPVCKFHIASEDE
jgi:hypothetical protein